MISIQSEREQTEHQPGYLSQVEEVEECETSEHASQAAAIDDEEQVTREMDEKVTN